jgi:hypothetical protein
VSQDPNQAPEPEILEAEVVPIEEAKSPPPESTTVGTGSYIALSCTVMALLVTAIILGILFLSRWL